jgi:hypothetical protein
MSASKTLAAPAQRLIEWRTARAVQGSVEEVRLQKDGWEPFAAWPAVPSNALGSVVILYRARVPVGAPIT